MCSDQADARMPANGSVPLFFDPESTWPELFAPLDARDRRAVVLALTLSWHSGWIPTRDDVADLIAKAADEIDEAEYARRVMERPYSAPRGARSANLKAFFRTRDRRPDAA